MGLFREVSDLIVFVLFEIGSGVVVIRSAGDVVAPWHGLACILFSTRCAFEPVQRIVGEEPEQTIRVKLSPLAAFGMAVVVEVDALPRGIVVLLSFPVEQGPRKRNNFILLSGSPLVLARSVTGCPSIKLKGFQRFSNLASDFFEISLLKQNYPFFRFFT